MLFPTSTFAIFFLIVLPLSWLLMPKVHRWRPFIVVASYVFYSWWDWHFIFLLAGSTLWNHALATAIYRARVASRRTRKVYWLRSCSAWVVFSVTCGDTSTLMSRSCPGLDAGA